MLQESFYFVNIQSLGFKSMFNKEIIKNFLTFIHLSEDRQPDDISEILWNLSVLKLCTSECLLNGYYT